MSSFQGLVDTQDLQSEQKTRYHVEAKMAPDENPMILSANVTRSLGRKTSFAATVKNVFSEPASLSGIQPSQTRNTLIFVRKHFKFSPSSGPGAQARWQQQAVLGGDGAAGAWYARHQDAGTDGAERFGVELCTEAQVWPWR